MSGDRGGTFNLASHKVSLSLVDGQEGKEAVVAVTVASSRARLFVDVAVVGQPILRTPEVLFEGNSMMLRRISNACEDRSICEPLMLVMGERRRHVERAIIAPQRNCSVTVAIQEGM